MNYNSYKNVTVFNDSEVMFRQIADELKSKVESKIKEGKKLYLGISGGNTPNPLFKLLADVYKDINWENVELFWVDERMVPEDDPESNYGMAKKILLNNISIPESNIHFIKGADDPGIEVQRYNEEITAIVPLENDIPQFDWIWLGMGADGHTASIFPGDELTSPKALTKISEHPVTKQKRITLTETTIRNSKEVLFILTGEDKNQLLTKIFATKDLNIPAARIQAREELKWYIAP